MIKILEIFMSSLLGLLIITSSAVAEETQKKEKDEEAQLEEIVVTVTGKIVDEATVNIPAVVESLTAKGIERINAIDTSDVFKYMPGSYLRKLYPGATNRPLVIRGNASFLTARTLVLMDGIQISDFLAAGNSNAPKWQMVAPEEIERVDVIYGPYSAALSGNSLSGTAVITTRFPQKREIQADVKYFYQNFREYKTDEDIQGYTAYGSYGDKLGCLSLMIWYDRLQTDIQPIMFMTKKASDGGAPTGNPVTGWESDSDPQGDKRYILGSPGKRELINNTFKIKLAYDLTPESQVRFIWAFWDSEQNVDSPETYLRDAKGNPVYSGKVDINGVSYNLSPSTFTYQKIENQDVSYGLTYSLNSSNGLKVSGAVSFYENVKDLTRTSGTNPPQSESGGVGKVADNDSGWYTADLKASYIINWIGLHTMGVGYHLDHYFTDSETWNASNWKNDARTSLSQGSEGKTQTQALFIEDTWDIDDRWSVYLGGRYELWKGFDGAKSTDGPSGRITTVLDDKSENGFSPKFSTTFSRRRTGGCVSPLPLLNDTPRWGNSITGGLTPRELSKMPILI